MKWKFINQEDGKKTPVMVRVKGRMMTNQCLIANSYGEHLKDQIETITKEIPDNTDDAMKLFEKLIPKVDDELVMEEASYSEVYKLVSSLKPSKCRGENEVTNAMLREIPQIITLAVLHLFNWMVRKGTFPKKFKTSRIIPLRKRDKDAANLDSFCPVNNLNPIEK